MSSYDVINNGDGTVTISEDYFDELFDDPLFLNALRNNGVDNWDGYGYAQEEYTSYNDEDDDE